ncbi:hypothetical protein EMIT093MI4_50153 [Pseudomonas sp. IT-93MI4]
MLTECADLFASKPALTGELHSNVGASLLAKAVCQATSH